MGGAASRRQGGSRGRPGRRELSQAGEGVCRDGGRERGAAVALGSARRLAGRTGRIAGGRRLTGGGVRPGCPRALLRFPACQILPQRLCLPLLPGGSLLRLIPVVVHAAVPFSNPAPGPSSRPKVPQCQPRKPEEIIGGSGSYRPDGGAGRLLASATPVWHVPPPRRSRRSSVVERALGKGEVDSSILFGGTISQRKSRSLSSDNRRGKDIRTCRSARRSA